MYLQEMNKFGVVLPEGYEIKGFSVSGKPGRSLSFNGELIFTRTWSISESNGAGKSGFYNQVKDYLVNH